MVILAWHGKDPPCPASVRNPLDHERARTSSGGFSHRKWLPKFSGSMIEAVFVPRIDSDRRAASKDFGE
jgi:hypothetical protein